MSVRIVIADDQHLVRMGMRLALEAVGDFEVVADVADGAEAVAAAVELAPDVVLMDVRMPGVDGIEATRRVAAAAPRVRVLVLTTFDLDEVAFAAVRAGAGGFLLKDVRPEELESAIRSVADGEAVMAPRITRRMLELFGDRLPAGGSRERLGPLTAREEEVLRLVGLGYTNPGIASHLFVSESTVKTHVGRVLAKLGLRDRVHAVIMAYETGLVRVGG